MALARTNSRDRESTGGALVRLTKFDAHLLNEGTGPATPMVPVLPLGWKAHVKNTLKTGLKHCRRKSDIDMLKTHRPFRVRCVCWAVVFVRCMSVACQKHVNNMSKTRSAAACF